VKAKLHALLASLRPQPDLTVQNNPQPTLESQNRASGRKDAHFARDSIRLWNLSGANPTKSLFDISRPGRAIRRRSENADRRGGACDDDEGGTTPAL
jgi:hypothetical protein